MTAQPAENFDDEQDELPPDEGDDAPEAPEQGEQEDPIEAKARRQGWRPKDEYKGPAEAWVPAADYLKKVDEELPRQRSLNARLETKVDKLEKMLEAVFGHQQRELEHTRKQSYAQAQADLKRQLQQATEDGDQARAERIMNSATTLAQQQVTEANAQPAKPAATNDTAIVEQWERDNPWYAEHPDLANIAAAKENALFNKGEPLEKRLKMVTEYMRGRFPKEVGGQQVERPRAPSGLNGSGQNGQYRNTKPKPGSYEALTAEARRECDRFVQASGKKDAQAQWLRFADPECFVKQ